MGEVDFCLDEAERRIYGKYLTKAEDKREIADYGMYKEFSMDEVRTVIEDAERFLVMIKSAIKRDKK